MGTVFVSFQTFGQRCQSAVDLLKSRGHRVVISAQEMDFDLFKESSDILRSADAVVAGTNEWTETQFKAMPNLKIVTRFGTGLELIDLPKAKEYGIKVANAQGANARSVAEHALGLTLDLLRQTSFLNAALRDGRWIRACGRDLCGMTVGLVGFGCIAQHFAKLLSGFDVEIMACRRNGRPSESAQTLGVRMAPVEDVLAKSDVLSLHIPVTPETRGIIDDAALAKMKRGVYLINTSRGALLDEEALIRAVRGRQVESAALDVFNEEPLSPDSPLLKEDRILCTPHTAADTKEAAERVGLVVAESIIAALDGREPANWMNR